MPYELIQKLKLRNYRLSSVKIFLLPYLFSLSAPALAHVKWFLSRSEDELLRQPKPALFTTASTFNVLPACIMLVALTIWFQMSRRFAQSKTNHLLNLFGEAYDNHLNLFLGLMTGLGFIYSGYEKFLCAPDFVICSHCPPSLPYIEYAIGASLLFGLAARAGGLALLGLLLYTFFKHSVADCLDLLPLYGVGVYFILVGRGRYSIDYILKIDAPPKPVMVQLAYTCLRLATGLGLVIMGIDEKLINPQLALDVLKYRPELDFLRAEDVTNALFVLLAGLGEVFVGIVLLLGSFPRIASAIVLGIFVATTCVFGSSELFGHLAYYGILAQLLVKGKGSVPSWTEIQKHCHETFRQLFVSFKAPVEDSFY